MTVREAHGKGRTMVSEKTLRFQGKSRDLNQLSQQIMQQLQSEGYKTQSKTVPLGIIIQAQKAGILRDIIAADRAFTIMVSGQPNDFMVHIGIGKWITNIAVAAAETLLLSVLFLAVDVPEMLWTQHVERGLAKEIDQIVQGQKVTPTVV
jgi:hypothetical protein